MTRGARLTAIPATLVVATTLGLAGCGGGEDEAASDATTDVATAEATTHAEEMPHADATADAGSGDSVPTIAMGAPGEFDMVPMPGGVDSGKVTFKVTNDGSVEHEVVVVRTDLESGQLPTDANGSAIERDVVTPATTHGGDDHHGLHVQPGQSATMTVQLPKGEYALICNLPGHYQSGMHANLEVS